MRALAWVSLVIAGCTAPVQSADPPAPDRCAFERDVYPVIARDCGFPACHGAPERFFRVYAPGRTRLAGGIGPATVEEIDATYERARSMLATTEAPEDSLLLRKPLEQSEGGAAHMGRDRFGRNVYRSRDDPRWRALRVWARGESAPCP